MATLAAGSSTTVTLSPGYCIAISSGSVQSMMGPGPIANTQRILSAGGQIGPFDRSQVVYLTATADAVYAVDQPASAFMVTPSQQTTLQSLVSGDGNVTSAALPTLVGTPGQVIRLSDGDDKGALLIWAIPSGASAYAWCWWLWPQSSYF